MIKNVFVHRALAALFVLGSSGALASGSEGGGGAETGQSARYHLGKSVYATKFACDTCPLSGKPLNAAVARELLVNQKGVSLADEDAQALRFYLKRRFKV